MQNSGTKGLKDRTRPADRQLLTAAIYYSRIQVTHYTAVGS